MIRPIIDEAVIMRIWNGDNSNFLSGIDHHSSVSMGYIFNGGKRISSFSLLLLR